MRARLAIVAVAWSVIAWGWAIFRHDLFVGLPDADGLPDASLWAAVPLVAWRIFNGAGLLLAGWLLYRSLRPSFLPKRAVASLCCGLICLATMVWGMRLGDRLRYRSRAAEIDYLERVIKTRWANRAIHEQVDGVRIDKVFAELRQRADSGAPDGYGAALRVALWQLGDGHLSVQLSGTETYVSDLAFVAVAEGVALAWAGPAYEGISPGDRLIAIDGQDPESFLSDRRYVAGSTEVQRRHAALGTLAFLQLMRGELPVPSRVLLESPSGARRDLAVTWRTPSAITQPLTNASRPLCVRATRSNGFGYLEITTFFCTGDDGQLSNGRFLRELVAAGETLRDVRDLIVDVRGNGGGTDEQGRMAAALLVSGRLDWYRTGLRLAPVSYRADDEVQVEPTDWPAIKPLSARLWVLIGPGCYSTCDIFAGALRARGTATFIGRSTGGGAGDPLPYRLPRSGFVVRVPSLEVFFPDGRPVETNPIEPDVSVIRTAADLRVGRDTVLEHAEVMIRTANAH